MAVNTAELSKKPSLDTVLLWTGLLLGPLVTLLDQTVAYALVPDACARQSSVFVHLAHAAAVLLVAAGFVLCRREWARSGRGEPDERPQPEHRARFLGFSGQLTNAFFVAVILAQWLATALFSPCSA